jgi:hypothetical protein
MNKDTSTNHASGVRQISPEPHCLMIVLPGGIGATAPITTIFPARRSGSALYSIQLFPLLSGTTAKHGSINHL